MDRISDAAGVVRLTMLVSLDVDADHVENLATRRGILPAQALQVVAGYLEARVDGACRVSQITKVLLSTSVDAECPVLQ